MKTLSRLVVASMFALSLPLLAGCAKDPVAPYPGGPGKDIEYAPPQYSEEGPREETLDASGRAGGGRGLPGDQNSDEYKRLHGRSSEQFLPIYFDFDQATIRADQFATLDKNADYLKDNPSIRIVIEGNCDERGTNEYNLALGERRALSAKTYLIETGVQESQMRTMSYGEERPLFAGQDESSWAQNRRDDFVLE
ncbi:MAG TPA: peptidoglycan-associated lipoprotein Pal [Desulfobulbaceae bacterium]|nr:peptidoglycan-associated lipoprotein Pal [Desulfobulbaceae bacterium]